MEAHECVRARRGDLFDVDTALRREHEERLLRAPIEREREVVLAVDVRALDPELGDDVPTDVEPEDLPCYRLGIRGGFGELDAARLASPSRQHLGLDHHGVPSSSAATRASAGVVASRPSETGMP